MTGVAGIIVKDCYCVLLALLPTGKPDRPMLQWQLSIKFQQLSAMLHGPDRNAWRARFWCWDTLVCTLPIALYSEPLNCKHSDQYDKQCSDRVQLLIFIEAENVYKPYNCISKTNYQ